jgi:hypothetical protein
MATWFTVIGSVVQIEAVSNSNYKNALVEFEEGDPAEKEFSLCRNFYIAFSGDLFDSGRSYIIFGAACLAGNEQCDQPKVSFHTYSILIQHYFNFLL